MSTKGNLEEPPVQPELLDPEKRFHYARERGASLLTSVVASLLVVAGAADAHDPSRVARMMTTTN